jgi:hypothetical protein
MKYYHWIIENTKTGERYETATKNKRAPRTTNNYKIIGCCGYHETPGTEPERSEKECI